MADDSATRGPQDVLRINVSKISDVHYWITKFGCTIEELKLAVGKVGVMAKDVKKALKDERREVPLRLA